MDLATARNMRACGMDEIKVGPSCSPKAQYIKNQEGHPRKTTYQEEFVALLTRRRMNYDERYLWD